MFHHRSQQRHFPAHQIQRHLYGTGRYISPCPLQALRSSVQYFLSQNLTSTASTSHQTFSNRTVSTCFSKLIYCSNFKNTCLFDRSHSTMSPCPFVRNFGRRQPYPASAGPRETHLSVQIQTEISKPPPNLSNSHLPPSAKELQSCSKPEYFHCKPFRCGKRPERPLNHREKSQQCRFRHTLYCPSSPYLLCQNGQAGARALEATLQAQHDETEHGRTSPTGDN
jgi:hypothetical protein